MIRRAQTGPRPVRAYHWLAALPGLGMLAGAVFLDRERPFVLGLPFLLFWILACVLATTAVMALIFRLDGAARGRAGEPHRDAGAGAGGPHPAAGADAGERGPERAR